jgi:hypothetical protein
MTAVLRWVSAVLLFAAALVRAGGAAPQSSALGNGFFDALDHPAIGYNTRAPEDPVAQLARKLQNGSVELSYDDDTGYLTALLRALDVPVDSQLAIFSKTSLQKYIISPRNPRAMYFNDSITVAWPRGGFIEIAAQDPRQGVMFYLMPQQREVPATITRATRQCLVCHHSYDTLGVPGMLVRGVVTASGGQVMPFLGNYLVDDRSPLTERWAGWFVTGRSGQARHLGNQMPPLTRDVDATVTAAATDAPALPDALDGYPSAQSDIVAHLVFDHQARVINLLTRIGWEVRLAEAERRDVAALSRNAARELVDALLFVDEAPLPPGIKGASGFAERFAASGPADSSGRSLRQLALGPRLMRHPCSYMVYSAAFDALPPAALSATYQRMWEVLSGAERGARYTRMAAADRRAIVEILRETKKGLPAYFGADSGSRR